MKKVKMYVSVDSIFTEQTYIIGFLQIDQQINSLFKSKKSIKAKGDAPVLPNATTNPNDDGSAATGTNDAASKLELAKKAAAR